MALKHSLNSKVGKRSESNKMRRHYTRCSGKENTPLFPKYVAFCLPIGWI